MSETSNPRPARMDDALRRLFAAASRPRPRAGFEQRLARALAEADARRRARQRLALWMGVYGIAALGGSAVIVWRLRDLLLGPGLWLGLASGGLLLSMALLFGVLVLRSPRRRSPIAHSR